MVLKNKTVKINEKKYTVDEQFYSFETGEEILVLKRKVKIESLPKSDISTIYDLGFNSPEEINFSSEELKEAWYNEIIPKTKNNEYINISYVDRSGLLTNDKIYIQSLDIENPSDVHVYSSTKKQKEIIDKGVLITGYLLNKMSSQKKMKMPGKQKDIVEKMINQILDEAEHSATRNSSPVAEKDFSILIEIFEEILKGR